MKSIHRGYHRSYCENCPNKYKDICEMSTICDSVYNKGRENTVINKIMEIDKSKTYLVEVDKNTVDYAQNMANMFRNLGINALFVNNRITDSDHCAISGIVDYDEVYAENCIRSADDKNYNADVLNTISALSGIDFKFGDKIQIHIIRTEGE